MMQRPSSFCSISLSNLIPPSSQSTGYDTITLLPAAIGGALQKAPVVRLRSLVPEPDAHRTRVAVGPGVVGNSRYPAGMGLRIPFARMHGSVETLFPPWARRGVLCHSLQYGHATEEIRLQPDGWLLAVQDEVAQVDTGVIYLLGAKEQGTAHKRNATRVLGDVGVAFDPTDRHREVHVYRVARTPRAAYL